MTAKPIRTKHWRKMLLWGINELIHVKYVVSAWGMRLSVSCCNILILLSSIHSCPIYQEREKEKRERERYWRQPTRVWGRQNQVTDIFWLKLEIKDPNTFALNQITRFPLKIFVSWEKAAERGKSLLFCGKWRRQVASPDAKTKETSELLNAVLFYGEAIL